MTAPLRICALILLTFVVLAGCGSVKTVTGSGTGHTTINITIRGGTVRPSGARIRVAPGSHIHLHITADAPGELDVHGLPEQHLGYDKGTTTKTIELNDPGVVVIQDHGTDKLIVQVEAR